MTLPPLFDDVPEPFRDHYRPDEPWALLGEALDRILAALPSERLEVRPAPGAHLYGDRVVIERGTRIHPGVVVEGPAYIGRDVLLRPGALLRGGCWIGNGAIVGANTEVKRGIFFSGARAPHLNYVGDSVLGAGVNLGAGTVLSNFRHDGDEISLPADGERLATGRRKLGAILGDGVLTGCNSVLHPGVVVGRSTQIYPGVQLRSGIYPADHRIKLRQELDIVPTEQRSPGA
ncbi:MAG: hypothetical protein AAF481_00215 [Acidobacteriota bacterium]